MLLVHLLTGPSYCLLTLYNVAFLLKRDFPPHLSEMQISVRCEDTSDRLHFFKNFLLGSYTEIVRCDRVRQLRGRIPAHHGLIPTERTPRIPHAIFNHHCLITATLPKFLHFHPTGTTPLRKWSRRHLARPSLDIVYTADASEP